MADRVGKGRMVAGGSRPARGRFIALLDVDSLMAAMDSGEEQLVAYLEAPNVTMMAPIQSRLAAIVCASGDESAHVAIVSRELELPCAVQVELERPPAELEGSPVTLWPDGTISLDD